MAKNGISVTIHLKTSGWVVLLLAVHKFTESEDGLDFFDLTSETTEWKDYLGFELARLHGYFVARMREYCDHYFGVGRTPDLALAQLTANI